MSRGATPYATRGVSLALPRGTLDNPAIRLGGERSGLYLAGPGWMGLTVRRFRALEWTTDGVIARSNATADTVSPLGMARVNAATVDGQQTALDVYEVGVTAARLAAYRQSASKTGWRVYGSTAGALSSSPDLDVSADGDLVARRNITALGSLSGQSMSTALDFAVGRDLTVARNLTVNGVGTPLQVPNGGGSIAGQLALVRPAGQTALSIPTGDAVLGGQLALSRAAGQTALSIPTGDAVLGGQLALSRAAGQTALSIPTGDVSVGGQLSATRATGTGLAVTSDAQIFGNLVIGGSVSASGPGGYTAVGPANGVASFSASATGATGNAQYRMASAGSGALGWLTLQGGASAFGLGTGQGDVSLYATIGRLVLGAFSVARISIEASGVVAIPGQLSVGGLVSLAGSIQVAGSVSAAAQIAATGAGTGLAVSHDAVISGLLSLDGPATALSVTHDALVGGLLLAYGPGIALAVSHDAQVGGVLTLVGPGTALSVSSNAQVGGVLTLYGPGTALVVNTDALVGNNLTAGGGMWTGGAAGFTASPPANAVASFTAYAAGATGNAQYRLTNATSGAAGMLTLQGGASGFGLGTGQGDVSLYASAGRLILGAFNVARLSIEASGVVTIPGPLSVGGAPLRRQPRSATGGPVTLTTAQAAAAYFLGILDGLWLVSASVNWLAGTGDAGALASVQITANGTAGVGAEAVYWTIGAVGVRSSSFVSALVTVTPGTGNVYLMVNKNAGSVGDPNGTKAEYFSFKAVYLGPWQLANGPV